MDETEIKDIEHVKMKKKKTFPRCMGMFITFIVGFAVGFVSLSFMKTPLQINRQDNEIRVGNSSYKFINPLLECDLGAEYITANEAGPTKEHLQAIIDRAEQDNEASFVSVYFRDLNDGPWLGIHENAKFAPASLLKLPIMMAALKIKESDPNFFSTKMKLDVADRSNISEYFTSGPVLSASTTYRVDDLVNSMIIDSNNDAALTLLDTMTTDRVYQVFDYLQVNRPTDDSADFLSVKSYAMFMRVLFNASYLDSDASEWALNLLSRSTFTKGLVAGVPKEVVVAHKFGERSLGNEKQLHDCGIVYVANDPYLLCVMTRGQNFDQLADVIAKISQATYQDVMLRLKK